MMIATFFLGKTVNGSKSWIPLGFMNLQPVEMAKIFTALALAKYLSLTDTEFTNVRTQLIAAGISFLPAVFSILQNETGLALVYFAFLIPMYREGLPAVYLIIGVSLAILLVISLLFPPFQLFITLSALALLFIYFLKGKIKRSSRILFIIIGIWASGVLFSSVAVPFLFRHVFQQYQADRIFSMVGRDNPFSNDKTVSILKKGGKKVSQLLNKQVFRLKVDS